MTFPVQTAFYGGLLGLLFVALSIWVSIGRAQFGAHHGDGGQVGLQRRIRIQGNFAEYVPIALLLVGLNEAGGAAGPSVQALLIALFVARLAHPIGMMAPEGSVQQYALRAPSMLATWLVIAIGAGMLIVR